MKQNTSFALILLGWALLFANFANGIIQVGWAMFLPWEYLVQSYTFGPYTLIAISAIALGRFFRPVSAKYSTTSVIIDLVYFSTMLYLMITQPSPMFLLWGFSWIALNLTYILIAYGREE